MAEQAVFFDNEPKSEWVIFHDESYCHEERYLYHGFLFVRRGWGKEILNSLLHPLPDIRGCNKVIHFCDLSGMNGTRPFVAIAWLKLVIKWLSEDRIRFYCFGVNLNNLNYDLFGKDHDENIYKRFYEIGLKSAIKWFEVDTSNITHVYFDQGKQDIDRFNKTVKICGQKIIQPLFNDCGRSKKCISKFLQLADVILGSIRRCYSSIGPSRLAQKNCVDLVYNLVEQYSNSKRAYIKNDTFYKRFCLGFFPTSNNLSVAEFTQRNINYYLKTRNSYYCDRETYIQREGKKRQMSLF